MINFPNPPLTVGQLFPTTDPRFKWDGAKWVGTGGGGGGSVPQFDATTSGIVPASGGGTTNFLRADGTWAAPPVGPVTVGYLLDNLDVILTDDQGNPLTSALDTLLHAVEDRLP